MNDKIIKLSEFIEEAKKDNKETESSDIRFNFFRLKVFNSLYLFL